MPKFILDTNILSELSRRSPNPGVTSWLAATPKVFVSVIAFHEVAFGVESAPRDQRIRLTHFLENLKGRFGPTAIPVNMSVSETAGRLRGFAKINGRILTPIDSLMAATAIVENAELVTRNTKDFEDLDLPLLNPFVEPN